MPRWSFTYSIVVLSAAIGLAGCPSVPLDAKPVANFSATPRTGGTGLKVTFTDLSTSIAEGPIVSWQWDFGDGARSSSPNPVHTYLTAGEFDVSLTVVSSGGTHTRTREDYIQVTSSAGAARIGANGGTAAANGVTITAAAGAFSGNVDFGITRVGQEIQFNVFETINRVGDTFRITHDNNTTNVAGSSAEEPIIPLQLAIPYAEDAIPTGDRISAKVHIVAELENGLVIPLFGDIVRGSVVARVTELPASAKYSVVYRPDAFFERVTVSTPAKVQTGVNWNSDWQLSLSPELLTQLTALRLGTVQRASSFGNRAFTGAQLDGTVEALGAGIAALQNDFESVRGRSPRLVTLNGAYTVAFFNFAPAYSPNIGSLANVLYAGHPFGSLVVDPQQLLAISTWNADRFAADSARVDIAQKLSAEQAVTEEITRAVVEGYDYPAVTAFSPADGGESISFAAGIREGLALYLGQVYGDRTGSRAQLSGDFVLLSTPLLAPFDVDVPGYAAAAQDFFRYVDNRYQPEPPLAYIARGTGVVKGFLEEIRLALDALNSPTFPVATEIAATAMDRAFFEYLGAPLGEVYLNFALDLAFEHGPDAVLRPSDLGRLPLVLDESRFSESAIITGTIGDIDGGLDFPLPGSTSLTNIPPLTSRAVKISANPESESLTLRFNRSEWNADSSNQGVSVVVFREGLPGVLLESDTLTFTDFEADPGLETADFYVLIVNGSTSTLSSVDFTAIAESAPPEV